MTRPHRSAPAFAALCLTVTVACGGGAGTGAGGGGAGGSIDVESFTDMHWGVPDGRIQWADLGPTKTSGCK
jgi:hypothetical protein